MMINAHLIKYFLRHFFTAKRRGHGVHSPFAYRLCEEVIYNTEHFYRFEQLAATRQQLLHDQTMLPFEDFGAGSRVLNGQTRKISDIAAKGISRQKQSELLYRLVNYMNCKTCIELGTSLGLNTLYLAGAGNSIRVTSVEGSPALCDYARNLAAKHKAANVEFVCARFDDVLSGILEKNSPLDFLYVDGNHTKTATIDYFHKALVKRGNNSVFVFDDIYWSPGMTEAWTELCRHPVVTLSIDLFYFGMVFFKEEVKEKVHLRLYVG